MELINFLRKESGKSLQPIVILAIISGIANAMLLAIVNLATSNNIPQESTTKLFLLYLVSISLFIITKQYVLKKSSFLVEEIIRKLRIKIAYKIRHSDLLHIEETGTAEIYACISQDAAQISQTVTYVVNAFQSVIMVLFSVIYIAFISIPAFLIILSSVVLGILSYLRYRKSATDLLKSASRKEAEFYGSLNELLQGFKEIKINTRKNNNVFNNFKKIAGESTHLKLAAIFKIIISYIASQSFFYILLAFIIFLLPAYVTIINTDLVKIAAAILFIIGPLDSIISSLPMLMTANVSAANIIRLENKLSGGMHQEYAIDNNYEQALADLEPVPFHDELLFQNIEFAYPKKNKVQPFSVGPINLTIKKGMITFITGGNGAGKSTFMKLLSGLYYPDKGKISVDGLLIQEPNYPAYRELFSIIFTDFFLFQKLYGLKDYDQQLINDLLTEMQIDQKTQIVNGNISNINLSTGQKKRLALIIAILEDKPVYIFDEVAADQDPYFKNYFYKTLLPKLKEKGKTIIAVTHDEFYFDDSDFRYKIEDGQFIEVKH